MKVLVFLSAILASEAAVISARVLEKRQTALTLGFDFFQSIATGSKTSPMTPVFTKKLKSDLFPTAIREQFIFGPFKAEPANGTHKAGGLKIDKQSDMIEQLLSGMCKDCMVLRATAELTDKHGKRLGLDEAVYTHHVLVVNTGRGMNMAPLIPGRLSCPAGKGSAAPKSGSGMMGGMSGMGGMMGGAKGGSGHGHSRRQLQSWGGFNPENVNIMIAKGNEGDTSIFSPINNTAVKSGYWIGANDRLVAIAEMINYKDIAQDVYFSLDIDYVNFSGSRPKEWLDVGFGIIMVEECGDVSLHPAKDKVVTYNSTEHIALGSGYIVGLTPHLHDGGLYIKLLVNDKVVCQADAIYGQDGGTKVNGESWETITSYSPCRDPVKIQAGDKVKTSSDYDLRQHKLRPDSKEHEMEAEGMAIALFQFAKQA